MISAPDLRRGETVRALIVLVSDFRGKIGEVDIVVFARTLMAAYKILRQVEFQGALPRSGTHKIDWRALQAEVWQEAG